jgi:hypothetical protein
VSISRGTSQSRRARRRAGATIASLAALAAAGAFVATPAPAVVPGHPGEIAFASNRIGPEDTAIDPETEATITDFDIFITRPLTEPLNLTANNTALVEPEGGGDPEEVPIDDLHPAVSPDGTKVAFTSNRPDPDDGSTDPDIYVMNIDGTGLTQITANVPGRGPGGMGAAEYEPAWSPDGTRLAYRFGDGLNADIWIVDIATKQATRLTGLTSGPGGPAGYDAEPAWSPDGTKIAFSNGKGPTARIDVVDVATKVISPLIDAPGISDASASWSPDGTTIAYRRGDEGAGGAIWSAPVSGGPATALTDPFGGAEPPEGENGEPAAYSDLHPVWSPDGKRIAFQSSRPDGPVEEIAGDPDLYVMNADGSGQERLPASAVGDFEPPPEPEPDPEEPGEGGPAWPSSDITPDWQTIPFAGMYGAPPAQCATPAERGTPKEVAIPARITPSYLRTNQRTGAAAVRRANAINAWLDAGIINADLCGGALSPEDLDSRLTVLSVPPTTTPPAPSPRKVVIAKAKDKDARIAANATQMCINQRIYQAAIVRANALRARIGGELTGGDVVDGLITQNRLRSDLMIAAATANPNPPAASTTNVTKPTRQGCAAVRFTPQQAAINRRISIQAVVRLNRLLDDLAAGLTGKNFKDGTVTKVDFAAGVTP